MSRFLPLLPLALVPAALAAPVPKDATPDFGSGGLLTRSDLEKVRFDSQPVKDGEARVRDEKQDPGEKPGDPPRPKNRYDIAVHMPRAKFRAGDPVPAYFVLRNNRGAMLGLGSRLDFSGPHPMLHGEECDFDVRDRSTGESVLTRLSVATHCGGGNLVEVPADGYYVVRADLNLIVEKPLPPGEYEVGWRYGRLRAAPVSFTVVPRNPSDPKPETAAKRPALHTFEAAAGDGEARFSRVHSASLAAALAVGPDGLYVPDVHAIPSADRLVAVAAVWKPYRDGDRLAATFRSVSPTRPVVFSEMPHLYLQLEAPGDAGPETLPDEAKLGDRNSEELTTPLTVEVRLPADWRERVGLSGSLGVAVLVTSKKLELPVGRAVERLQKAVELRAERGGERPPVWGGVLRTEPAELRFPPASPPLSRVQYLRLDDIPDFPSP